MYNSSVVMKAAFDRRCRRLKLNYSSQVLIYYKFCNAETAGSSWADLIPKFDAVQINPGPGTPVFSFAESVSFAGSHKALLDHLQSDKVDWLTWYNNMDDTNDFDPFEIDTDFTNKCRAHGLSYPGEVLAYLLHPKRIGLNLINEHHVKLITQFYLSEMCHPRLLGHFAESQAEILTLPPTFWW